jgi:hypothetical protein
VADLTKFSLHSDYPAFKNNSVYTGSFVISGTANVGLNTRTATVVLEDTPDFTDILFSGRADSGFGSSASWPDARPSAGWFKQGYVYVRGDGGAFSNYPTVWRVNAEFSGATLTITARCRLDFDTALSLTSETVTYRLVDYSVF